VSHVAARSVAWCRLGAFQVKQYNVWLVIPAGSCPGQKISIFELNRKLGSKHFLLWRKQRPLFTSLKSTPHLHHLFIENKEKSDVTDDNFQSLDMPLA